MPAREKQPDDRNRRPREFGWLRVYPDDFLVRRRDELVVLTPRMFQLLLALVDHPNRLLTRGWLRRHVWKQSDISLRSIDAQISKLRKLLPELNPAIVTVYGRGYVLTTGAKCPSGSPAGGRGVYGGQGIRSRH